MAKKKQKPEAGGGVATQEPPLPAYDEGRVESVGEGSGQGRDDSLRTAESPTPDDHSQAPKLSDQPDAFISSEVAESADFKKTGKTTS